MQIGIYSAARRSRTLSLLLSFLCSVQIYSMQYSPADCLLPTLRELSLEDLHRNYQQAKQETLISATASNKIDMIRSSLILRANSMVSSEEGKLALHIALDNNFVRAANILLNDYCKKHDTEESRHKIFWLLAHYHGGAYAEIMHDCFADINSADSNGNSLLSYAVMYQNEALASFLLEQGARIDSANKYGMTALWLAAQKGYTGEVLFLLNAGADIDMPNQNGVTPLHIAVWNNHRPIVTLLRAKGACFAAKTYDWWTPMHAAAFRGHTDMINFLSEDNSLDINAVERHDATPLHLAAQQGHYDVVNALLDKGANPFARTDNRMTAFYLAYKNDHNDVAQLLQAKVYGSWSWAQSAASDSLFLDM